MNYEKLMQDVKIAYKYGFDQRGKRIEPTITILAWCGWKKLPKPYSDMIYSAYKAGRFKRLSNKP